MTFSFLSMEDHFFSIHLWYWWKENQKQEVLNFTVWLIKLLLLVCYSFEILGEDPPEKKEDWVFFLSFFSLFSISNFEDFQIRGKITYETEKKAFQLIGFCCCSGIFCCGWLDISSCKENLVLNKLVFFSWIEILILLTFLYHMCFPSFPLGSFH